MVPPEMVNGTFPVALYNLGGPISNLIVSLVFLPVLILAPQGGYFALFSFLMIGVGIVFGMSNGVPLRTKSVDNDGYNAVSLRKNKEAMRAFWIQMKVNEQLRHGVRRVSGEVISTSELTYPISSRNFLYNMAMRLRGATNCALNFDPCQLSLKCCDISQAMAYIRCSDWLIWSA